MVLKKRILGARESEACQRLFFAVLKITGPLAGTRVAHSPFAAYRHKMCVTLRRGICDAVNCHILLCVVDHVSTGQEPIL